MEENISRIEVNIAKLTTNVERISTKVESLTTNVESLTINLDNLARMTAEGFAKNEEDHRKMWQFMNEESRWTRAEIHDIKTTLLPIAQLSGEHEVRLDNHDIRMDRLEKKESPIIKSFNR
ncbi:MAG: hypothetical protein RL641_819 [Candidatus Parcubacteria bacterium]